MTTSRSHLPEGGWREMRMAAAIGLLLIVSSSLLAGQAAAPSAATLTLAIKGSTTYAKPTPVALQTALFVLTPAWEDIYGEAGPGSSVNAGTKLTLSDMAVVLSNRALDCTTIFTPSPVAADQDFVIVAGKAEAYEPNMGWQTTSVGKIFSNVSAAPPQVPIDRFSTESQYFVQKRKTSSKDGLKNGKDTQLVLQKTTDGGWLADFILRADDINAEGKIPLKSCTATTRKKASATPLLGEKRLQASADAYGK